MYGAYVEVAAYSQTWDRRSSDTFLHNEALVWLSPETSAISETPSFANSSAMQNAATEDFILVCEVSEIEGPKPLFTIPQHMEASIDLSALAEKIMSVDYHSGNSGPFAFSSDTQVILSNVADGLHAVGDYFILYDISARGFVRPFSITYFSTDKRKLMEYFESIRCRFLEISKYLKFGNRRLFLQELEQYLEDLQIAKGISLGLFGLQYLRDVSEILCHKSISKFATSGLQAYDYVKKCRDPVTTLGEENTNKTSIINHFANSIIEAQHLLSAKRPLLEDASAAAVFWKVETKIKSLHNLNFYQLIKPFVLVTPMHSPKLLSLISDVKHAEMRSIFELCSWGVVIGLDLMISMQKYYKRDSVILYMENEDLKFLEPDQGKILVGNHVIANAVLQTEPPVLQNISEKESLNIDQNLAKLETLFMSACSSSNKTSNSLQSGLPEYESDSGSEIYDDANEEPEFPLPESKPLVNHSSFFNGVSWPSLLVNWRHFGDEGGLSQSPGKESYWSVLESLRNSHEPSPVLEPDIQPPDGLLERNISPVEIIEQSRPGMKGASCCSLACHIEFLTPDKPGYGIASVFDQFPSFPHALYSLLVGRPVIIVGYSSHEELVRSVVQAFDIFVPLRGPGRSSSVLPWCTGSFKSKNFSNVRLVGLCVPDNQNEFNYIPLLPNSLISVINVVKNTYIGPLYMGNALSSLFRIKRNGWDDAALLSYLHGLILGLVTNICLDQASLLQVKSMKNPSDTQSSVGSISNDDDAIMRHFTELLIDSP